MTHDMPVVGMDSRHALWHGSETWACAGSIKMKMPSLFHSVDRTEMGTGLRAGRAGRQCSWRWEEERRALQEWGHAHASASHLYNILSI